ncbi:MAG: apolipoprotein N-acyltransferase, partial [Acidobacteriota bacterium]
MTFAPITYAGFPAPLAYFLLFFVTSAAAVFPGVFAAITSLLLKRFGSAAFLAVPFVWVFAEFLRYWLTGNNWNAVGYSQAFNTASHLLPGIGGVHLVGFAVCVMNIVWLMPNAALQRELISASQKTMLIAIVGVIASLSFVALSFGSSFPFPTADLVNDESPRLVAIQPNVPMSGLTLEKWTVLRRRHVTLAESVLRKFELENNRNSLPTTVIFPESPMNFMYEDDPETQEFINGFAKRNNVSVLFNSAEPDASNGKFFNSAVMVGPDGKEVAQYDKIYLLPFGEAVPFPLEGFLPGFVGNFSYGREYDLLPLGDAKAGVMICFESHFGQLSREYVRNGADVIIEMTNDGYLGPTPVLRQHLANAVFRAVETNRPVLRVTNVGITAYINERGQVLDPA